MLKNSMPSTKDVMYGELSREKLEQALQQAEKELETKEDELEELENTAKKVKADFENYKKKEDDRKEKWKKEAERELAEDLISVIDNFERALAAADENSNIYQGVKMVGDQLFETLKNKGLERINAEGEEFDPNIHNAVDTRKHEKDNQVIEQKKPGYIHDGKVLRPADVVVSDKEE